MATDLVASGPLSQSAAQSLCIIRATAFQPYKKLSTALCYSLEALVKPPLLHDWIAASSSHPGLGKS